MVQGDNPGRSIRASQISQAVQLLRKLRISAVRIAAVLEDTPDNIRHIDNRAYAKQPVSILGPVKLTEEDVALARLSEEQRAKQARLNMQGIRIRAKLDLDAIEATVWQIVRNHTSVGFEEAHEALLARLPGVANARHGQARRIKLLIHERLAWFLMPIGETKLALRHAKAAMKIAVEAYRESSGDKQYLLRYGEAALVASICLQKQHYPKASMRFIEEADRANIAAGQLPGSEHLRQRGSVFLQLGPGYDDLAKDMLRQAPERMERKNEARHSLDLDMTGVRRLAFIRPRWGWERSVGLANATELAFGKESLQHRVAARSAATVGLKLGTQESVDISLKLLSADAANEASQLLSMTPELGLKNENLDRWLRFIAI